MYMVTEVHLLLLVLFISVCVFNTLTLQSNASKQQQSAADNELL